MLFWIPVFSINPSIHLTLLCDQRFDHSITMLVALRKDFLSIQNFGKCFFITGSVNVSKSKTADDVVYLILGTFILWKVLKFYHIIPRITINILYYLIHQINIFHKFHKESSKYSCFVIITRNLLEQIVFKIIFLYFMLLYCSV